MGSILISGLIGLELLLHRFSLITTLNLSWSFGQQGTGPSGLKTVHLFFWLASNWLELGSFEVHFRINRSAVKLNLWIGTWRNSGQETCCESRPCGKHPFTLSPPLSTRPAINMKYLILFQYLSPNRLALIPIHLLEPVGSYGGKGKHFRLNCLLHNNPFVASFTNLTANYF